MSPVGPRNRFVLFVLAYLADDDGRCTVSLSDLTELTSHPAPAIRASLKELEHGHRLVEMTRSPSQANTYQLNRAELEAQQLSRLLYSDQPLVDLLGEHGLDTRSINALHRGGIDTLDELGAKIDAYRRAPAGKHLGLHDFLGIGGLGERSALRVMDSYTAWCHDDPLD
jgi:hypothetical protein